MHESTITNALALQVFILIVMFLRNMADTKPKNQITCLDNCDIRRYETTNAKVKAKHDKFFSSVGVPCPPPNFLRLVCDLNIGINVSCDTRAYIMEFCYRNNSKTYIIDESFFECETRCPESVCMQMLLFKKWGLSKNSLNTGGSINMMHHKSCFFHDLLDTVTESTIDITAHVEKEPFKTALTVICLAFSSLIMIVYLVYVIYLQASNRMNKFGKKYRMQTKELETEYPIEESINRTVRCTKWSPRMQDRRSFPVYDKLPYIDSEQKLYL